MVESASKNKRKGDEEDRFRRAVVFTPRKAAILWEDCKQQLDSILRLPDNFSNNVAGMQILRDNSFSNVFNAKKNQVKELRKSIDQEIVAATQQIQQESAATEALRETFNKLVDEEKVLAEETRNVQAECGKLRQEIAKFQEIIENSQQQAEWTRRYRKSQVPRLQQQISLYATMTGIKWDFDVQDRHPGVLVGEVVRNNSFVGTCKRCLHFQSICRSKCRPRIPFAAFTLIGTTFRASNLPTACGI